MTLTHPDSSTLIQTAEDRLRRRLDTAISDLSCDYRDGVLSLHGRSKTFYDKQRAQEAVRNVEGVSRVVNQINVATDWR